jgi:putative ABC transport system permease protein
VHPALSMTTLLQDIRFAARSLRKTPGFTAVVVIVLALGIGANTAIFSVVNALLLKPLPFPDAARLVEVGEARGNDGMMSVSYPNYLDWRAQNQVFDELGAISPMAMTLAGPSSTERVSVGFVTASFFPVFQVHAALGRDLQASDDNPAAPPVVLLSNSVWKTRYGSDPAIVNRTVTLDRKAYTVVGVLPPFHFSRTSDYYIPIGLVLDAFGFNMRENHNNLRSYGRLKAGATISQARAQFATLAAKLEHDYPQANGGMKIPILPLRESVAGEARTELLVLLGAVALVLLVACANVANLLLARASLRRREMAIRAAVGASRAQIVQQTLVESLLLALASAGLGLVAAQSSLDLLVRLFPVTENVGGVVLDWRVLTFALLAAVLTAVVAGLFPALQITRLSLTDSMRNGDRAVSGVPMRKVLIVSEMAIAVVLLAGSGLLIRSLYRLLSVDPGFRPEHVLVAAVDLPDTADSDMSRQAQFFERLVQRAETLPGVKIAANVSHIPFDNNTSSTVFYSDDRPIPQKGQFPDAIHKVTSPGYFKAMGIPLLKGRLFDSTDGRMPPLKRDMKTLMAWWQKTDFKVVINETMAKRYWPNQDPIGKTFHPGFPDMKGPVSTVIGVVADARHENLATPPAMEYYDSAYLYPSFGNYYIVLRCEGDPLALAQTIRATVHDLDPAAVVTRVRTMDNVVSSSLSGRRTNLGLLVTFAGLALLLAVVGTYGVMAYLVAQRRREIGIRMALGAAGSQVMTSVVREALLLAGVGIVVGLLLSVAASRLVSSMLYGIQATDTFTYVAVSVLLLLATAAATYLPARRAMRVDPAVALRSE